MKRLIFLFGLIIVSSLCFAQQNVSATQKHALVIGNSNYTGISRLNNPVNDANDMETTLRALGFTVEKVLNGSLEQMETAVLNLKRRLGGSRNSYGFVFYSGHGVQSNGENYLIPVAADNIRSETQLRERAVSLQFVLDSLGEAGNELNMVVLDACRDNPFGWARSGSRGLNVVSRAPSGTIVMYAAGAGQTASDGTDRNGLFTSHLLINLKDQSLSVFDIFDRTMDNVIKVTSGRQHPELSLRASGSASIYLGNRPSPNPSPNPSPSPAPNPTPQPTPALANMVRIQGGTFTMGSPASQTGRRGNEMPHQVTVSSFYMGKYEVTQREYVEVMGTNPSNFTGDLNRPVEQVSWFDAVEYCNRLSRKEGLTPAYTISGSGVRRTVTWNRSANGYRLPTEAEWEYACRAGTTSAYNTGANVISSNTGWYFDNSNRSPQPVGQKPANAWGLHDMHGNVWEWCWDWYGDYSIEAQNNPIGPASGYERVVRGGSWDNFAGDTYSSLRFFNEPYYRDFVLGFRVVRP